MFPHTITIFNKDENDVYSKSQIKGVYWYGSLKRHLSGKGVEDFNEVNIVIPLIDFKDIVKGSIIVKGEYNEDISSIADLEEVNDCITVADISTNDVGSNLDNVVVRGV